MMAGMRTVHPHDSLQDGFEPGPLQVGPDGIALSDNARIIPPPPSLCEAGPCRNYHRFVTQLDANRPLAASVAQGERHGALEGDGGPQPFHTKVHRWCYPTSGVELELNDMPVLECNRWTAPSADSSEIVLLRGQYAEQMAQWRRERDAEDREIAGASGVEIDHVTFVIEGAPFEVSVDELMTLGEACRAALVTWTQGLASIGESGVIPELSGCRLEDADGNPITNLDSTLAQLGVSDGETFTLILPEGV